MKRYSLPTPAVVEMPDPFGERFRFEADAGEVVAKNEREEAALEHLVALGLAERAASKPRKGN